MTKIKWSVLIHVFVMRCTCFYSNHCLWINQDNHQWMECGKIHTVTFPFRGPAPPITTRLIMCLGHDDVIKWTHFPSYWPFVRGNHLSPVNSPHKGQWRGALIFLSAPWINSWTNKRDTVDLRRYRAQYDVTVMVQIWFKRVLLSWQTLQSLIALSYIYWVVQFMEWTGNNKTHQTIMEGW